jgi:pimeloyl-ACP methyl ester carboxylesterase
MIQHSISELDPTGWRVDSSMPTRVYHQDGRTITVDIAHLGDAVIFTQLFLPAGPPLGGLVVCSPMYAEATRNERREFTASIDWAARGVSVIRFHYRGTGHSAPLDHQPAFDQLVEDALSAARYLIEYAGLDRCALLGTRFGALVAGAAAASIPGAPLVFWQPSVSTDHFYKEVFRAKLMGGIAQGRSVGGSTPSATAFETQEVIDVIGHRVGRVLYNSAAGRVLAETPGLDGRHVLLVQMSNRPGLLPAYAAMVRDFQLRGCLVSHTLTTDDGAWWFGKTPGTQEELEPEVWSGDPTVTTGDFLVARFQGQL